jgi:hypothetical protein
MPVKMWGMLELQKVISGSEDAVNHGLQYLGEEGDTGEVGEYFGDEGDIWAGAKNRVQALYWENQERWAHML